MAQNAAPQSGDVFLLFNGTDSYVEIPSIDAYSVVTSGALTVSAWIRPDVVNFPNFEGTHYVHWMGKGEGSGSTGQQEWTFRMYNRDGTTEDPPRPNRISFYVFNPEGGLGVGSYVQDTVQVGEWIHVVGIADSARTYFYRDGTFIRCRTYRGDEEGGCPIEFTDSTDETQLVIDPQMGSCPLRIGTRDFASFFEGGIARVRIWSRVLIPTEITALYESDTVPQTGLVGEFRLDAGSGSVATDTTTQGNDGTICNATWATQV